MALTSLAAACSGSSVTGRAPAPAPLPEVASAPVIVWNSRAPQRPDIETPRRPVVEQLFGRRIEDPYRWLEAKDSPEVQAWIEAQNRLLERTLGALPERSEIHARLQELLEIGDLGLPAVRRLPNREQRLFYRRREGKQNQPVLYVRDGSAGADRVLFDPNQLSAEGRVSLDWFYPSDDGSLVAYGTSEDGSEESVLRIRRVETGQDTGDVIPRTRHASLCWTPDNRRFYYSRFPEPGSVKPGDEHYYRRMYEHVLGQDPARDRLVFGAELAATDYPGCSSSPDGRWLVMEVHQGWSKSELYLADTRARTLRFRRLTSGAEHVYETVARNDAIYVRSNEGASRYRLFRVDPEHPERARWRELIAEHPGDVLQFVELVSDQIFAVYAHAGISRVERFDRAGKSLGRIELGMIGSTDRVSGAVDGDEAFFDFQSFVVPPAVYRVDLKTGRVSPWRSVSAPVKADDFQIIRREARSKDGTRVPYLVVARRDVALDSGDNPTLLTGYGGFNVSLEPRFSRTNYALLERGVVWVQANLRGGGEFGESWHRAGQLENKQNVFDDFFAVSRDLFATKLTRPEQLGISGRSNGGLLVGAAITQHPELYRVAIIGVPLADMLRYHRFLIAKLWIPEYGSPEDPEQFPYLLAYSPYHRVRPGTRYPAVLLTTAASDSRVDPMHARKMAAALQHATTSGLPVLLRSELGAGHGAGKPIARVADEQADAFTFLLWQLGMLKQQPGP